MRIIGHPEAEPEAMGRIPSGILDSIPQEKPPESGKKPYSSSASESTGQISRVKRKDGRISDCKGGPVRRVHRIVIIRWSVLTRWRSGHDHQESHRSSPNQNPPGRIQLYISPFPHGWLSGLSQPKRDPVVLLPCAGLRSPWSVFLLL